jgi:beta-phosphoglucomutase-like phosphatase (HAD superfamily)
MVSDLIIFDCDGVLIDSELIACRVSATCLSEIGIPITVEEDCRALCGYQRNSDVCGFGGQSWNARARGLR